MTAAVAASAAPAVTVEVGAILQAAAVEASVPVAAEVAAEVAAVETAVSAAEFSACSSTSASLLIGHPEQGGQFLGRHVPFFTTYFRH